MPDARTAPAEQLGLSGVLGAVTVGIYLGWRAPELITPSTKAPRVTVENARAMPQRSPRGRSPSD